MEKLQERSSKYMKSFDQEALLKKKRGNKPKRKRD